MTKFDIMDDFDPNDSHSVNISVYKPDGILSFWNWFTRRNKNETQRKNIKFKINKEDLDRMKLSGFDFQKLQNLAANSKDKSARQCNVFAIPKTDLDPFFMKTLQTSMNTKTYVKRLISKSTISIRSKESCANLKYIRTVRSQKSVVNSVKSSKTSIKVSRRSNTNANVHSNQPPRNLFLKSVPTTVLKSNTNKLLILGKMKSPRGNRTARTNASENVNHQHYAKEKNVIPMLLTRMKSMEEHLSDIENTTKKINEAVSQRNVVRKVDSRNDLSNTERNRQKPVKCVASHKIYSKNIHAPRKNKKNRTKKLKNKSKTNVLYPNEAPSKPKPPNKGFAFNYFSDSSNESKNMNDIGHSDIRHNKPELSFNQQGFTLPNNIATVGFSQGDPNNVGCDFIMSVVKALTETKGSTNLKKIDKSFTQNKPQYPNIGAEVGVINLGRSNVPVMSKTTFDWKHTSVSTSSEPQISEASKSNQDNIKVKKNVSVTFGQQDVSHDPCKRNDILNQILDPSLQKQIFLELLRNNNATSLPVKDETKTIGDKQTRQTGELLETIEVPNTDLEVTEHKTCNDKVDDINNPEIGLQKKASTKTCLHTQKSSHSTKVIESHKATNELSLEQEQFRSDGNHNGFQESSTLPAVIECSEMTCAEKRPLTLQSCDENGSEITIDRGPLCSVSIKQNAFSSAAFANSPGKQFKRTTISCSNAKKEPKVSITILVQDGMKGEVKMKSNLPKNLPVTSKDECVDRSPLREECSPPLSSCGPRGDQLSIVQSDTRRTESGFSLENLSSVSCTPHHKSIKAAPVPKTASVEKSAYSRKNNNFYVEVEDEGRKTLGDEDLNLGSPGTYLTHEKRKVLEEKVLGCKQTSMPLVKTGYEKETHLSPTRSCSNISNGLTSFDHMIETSIIRQETSYSKTKFNICKENKFNSRASSKPSESCKRCPFSDESLSAENNFDISTKYTSQQCVMYCRNNKVANFRRPEFPLYQEKSLESSELEKRKLPFMVVHTPSSSKGNLVVDPNNNNSCKVWRTGLNLREDPILEVSEDETVVEKITFNEQYKDETNSIEIKTSHESLRSNLKRKCDKGTNSGNDKNILDDTDMPSKKGQKVQHEDSVAILQCQNTSLKSDCDTLDSESKYAGLRSSEPKGTTTSTSRISQTVLSSTLVQTDWSLVGITVDHLNCSNDKSESMGYKKRTVASQTEVMMDQIALRNKDLEELNSCCKSCVKSSQFSELVACNVTVSQAACLPEAPKILLGKMSGPFNDNEDLTGMGSAGMLVVKDKDSNTLELSSSNFPVDEDILKSHLLEQMQTPTLTSSKRKHSCRLNYSSLHCENESEESLTLHEDLLHICTIPCLTSMSDETVMSSLSESSNKTISRSVNDCHTGPHIHAINRGICSYFDAAREKRATNYQLLSPIEESRSSTSETANSPFCRVLGGLDVDNEEASSQDENCCTASRTSPCESGAVKDATVDRGHVCTDCPDRLEDEKEPPLVLETRLEHSSETKKGNVNTKVQGRRTGFKNYTLSKPRKRDYSCNKCTDYMIQYLSIERCDEEKKGNSLFSQT